MLKKKLITIVVIIVAVLAVRFIIGGSEDDWICVDNEWVKHGVPSAPKPTSGCGDETQKISSFIECLEAGFPIMESYPRQCRTPEGELFIEGVEPNNPPPSNLPPSNPADEFCGSSTEFNCSTSVDCQTAGCSGQICMGKDEEPISTTCEWRDCYNETMYDLTCQCLNSQCQWSK